MVSSDIHPQAANKSESGGALEVFLAFLRLGLTSFGGPIAHRGCFREAFVVKRGWLDDRSYADLAPFAERLEGALICLVAIFLPSFLLVIGALPFWEDLRRRSGARAALAGVNAPVVDC